MKFHNPFYCPRHNPLIVTLFCKLEIFGYSDDAIMEDTAGGYQRTSRPTQILITPFHRDLEDKPFSVSYVYLVQSALRCINFDLNLLEVYFRPL